MIPIKSVKRFEALTLTSLEKNGLEFFTNFFPKSLSIFTPKNRGFLGGQTWAVGKPYHPANGPSKNIRGLLFKKNWIFNELVKKVIFSLLWNGAKLQFYSKNEKLYNSKVSQPIQMRFGMGQHLPRVLWHTKSYPDRFRYGWVLGLGPSHQAREALQMGFQKWTFLSPEATVLILEHWSLDML